MSYGFSLKGTTQFAGLVLLAVSAHASSVFSEVLPTANETCNATTHQFGTLTCGQFGVTASDAALSATSDGLAGVKFYLGSGLVDNEGAGTGYSTVVSFSSSGNATGNGSELAGILIPFTFDFTLTASNAGTLSGYTVVYNIKLNNTTSIFTTAPTFTGTLTGNSANVTGGGQFATTAPITNGQSYTVSAVLTVNWSANGNTSGLTVGIPANSLDVNSPTFVATPEPGTFGMLGAGLLGGGLLIARRRKS